jgi:hypothetical protein
MAEEAPKTGKTVLIAIDGSEHAKKAFDCEYFRIDRFYFRPTPKLNYLDILTAYVISGSFVVHTRRRIVHLVQCIH